MPPSDPPRAVHVVVSGQVQGVGFRFFALEEARSLGLRGWVRNLPNGSVEAWAEGPTSRMQTWVDSLRHGPLPARVDGIQVHWEADAQNLHGFEVEP